MHAHTVAQHKVSGQPQHGMHGSMQPRASMQASMQHYYAPQPAIHGIHRTAQFSHHSCNEQAASQNNNQHPFASGVLADDCIDLVSQSDVMAAASDCQMLTAKPPTSFTPGLHAVRSKVDADQASVKDNANMTENSAEDGSLEELMTASTNLLNPGIRVHKYSKALFA